jgi:hypothetical protein
VRGEFFRRQRKGKKRALEWMRGIYEVSHPIFKVERNISPMVFTIVAIFLLKFTKR